MQVQIKDYRKSSRLRSIQVILALGATLYDLQKGLIYSYKFKRVFTFNETG